MASRRGAFITFEGGEGSGKSTQIKRLEAFFQELGRAVTVTREPGGSTGAEQIRALLLGVGAQSFDPLTQTLLFSAARRDHVETLVRPALRRGNFVLCDRFMDSTRAYQGAGGAVSATVVHRLERLAVGRNRPDLTIILDVDPAIGLARARQRLGAALSTSDPFERQPDDFHRRVRQEFLAIAAAEPRRCAVIDAARPVDDIASDIHRLVETRLARFLTGRGA